MIPWGGGPPSTLNNQWDNPACLPLLATYLGHINLSGTQTYLTMTAELLGEASLRFERYAALGQEDDHA